MLNRFKHIVEEMRGLIDDSWSASFLLAVSGGIDSMCLADMWLSSFGSGTCAIAHCNFNLRGEDSDGDEALVTGWAEEHGVRIHKISFDTVQYASGNGVSIEMAARELRYRWFGELCQKYGYRAVVVAHHADDNAETMVLNMVRGAGLKGISGMNSLSQFPASFLSGDEEGEIFLLRPLLTFTRKQIEGHAFANKVPYREDKTNSSVEYRRNSVRHEVFPLFKRMNPSYVRTLNREMTYFKDASDIVDQWCREQLPKVVRNLDSSLSISTRALLEIPQWRYLLYYMLEPYGFNSSVLESLESLLTSGRTVSGKRFESDTHILLTERYSLGIHPKDVCNTASQFMPVRCAGTYNLGNSRFIVEVLPWKPDMPLKQPSGTIIFDAARLKFPFVCRSWRQGDWFQPLGMRGRKKVSDFFADIRYGQIEKSQALMIVDCKGNRAEDQHIAGILGNRIDDYYKVTEDTVSVIRISVADLI